jgi:hypothetical protein
MEDQSVEGGEEAAGLFLGVEVEGDGELEWL